MEMVSGSVFMGSGMYRQGTDLTRCQCWTLSSQMNVGRWPRHGMCHNKISLKYNRLDFGGSVAGAKNGTGFFKKSYQRGSLSWILFFLCSFSIYQQNISEIPRFMHKNLYFFKC